MAGAVMLVHLHKPFVDLDVELLQPEALGDPFAPDGHQDPLALQGLDAVPHFGGDGHPPVGALE